MSRQCIAVDICNTISDVNGVLDSLGQKRQDGIYDYPVVTGPDYFADNLWIFSEARPIIGSQRVLNELNRWYEIVYLTARPKDSEFITRRWLSLNHYPKGKVIHTDKKADVALSLNVRFSIDDSPKEIESYRKAGIFCLVPEADYNVSCPGRFSWIELDQIMMAYGNAAIMDAIIQLWKEIV